MKFASVIFSASKKKAVISLAVFAFFMPMLSLASVSTAKLLPLYVTHNAYYTDYFYTTSASERDASISYGYVSLGKSAYVESTNINGALPFARYVKMAPQYEHFYTISAAEQSYVTTYLGYSFEGIEGYLHPSQANGTVPFYRLNSWNPYTGDLQHYYTTNVAEYQGLVSQGWGNDGVAGYVWAIPAPSQPYERPSVYYFVNPYTGRVNFSIPSVYDVDLRLDGACDGTVDVFIDNTLKYTAGAGAYAWNYGILPGTFGTYGCYGGVFDLPLGQHTIRLEFSGYSYIRTFGTSWQTVPPATYQRNF